MFFRELDESVDLANQEGYSSSGCSLGSSETYCTRNFENRMKQLSIVDSALDEDIYLKRGLTNVVFSPKNEITDYGDDDDDNQVYCVSDAQVDESQVFCFNCDGCCGWGALMHKPDGAQQPDTRFYEYPGPEFFKNRQQKLAGAIENSGDAGGGGALSQQQNQQPHHHGTKMFIGGLRFEVVQTGRHLISWIFEMVCGVQLPPSSILVHRKAKGGRSGSPTGCASVLVPNEEMVKVLLAMNQRIFCGERGVFVTDNVERMTELIASKAILAFEDGRPRGPTHPVIIERAYGAAGQQHGARSSTNATPCQENVCDSLTTAESTSIATCSSVSSMQDSLSVVLGPNASVKPEQAQLGASFKEPIYHKYPGDAEAKQLLLHTSETLKRPGNVFVGGFPVETGREFVAWVFFLMNVSVHPNNVTLYVDSQSGEKDGCVVVRMERQDVQKATAWSKRALCDSQGVFFASSQREIVALVATRNKSGGHARALVIKRKDGDRCTSKAVAVSPPLMFPGTWDNTQAPPVTWNSPKGGNAARPPPPPYMQNVIIGNQTYQVPVGSSIQLQLVPVITGPNISPGGLPLQPAPLPVYQSSHFVAQSHQTR